MGKYYEHVHNAMKLYENCARESSIDNNRRCVFRTNHPDLNPLAMTRRVMNQGEVGIGSLASFRPFVLPSHW